MRQFFLDQGFMEINPLLFKKVEGAYFLAITIQEGQSKDGSDNKYFGFIDRPGFAFGVRTKVCFTHDGIVTLLDDLFKQLSVHLTLFTRN